MAQPLIVGNLRGDPAVGLGNMSGVAGAGFGRRIPVLQRWLGTVVALLETDAAVLVISHEGLSRIVVGVGTRHPMVSWRFDFATAPYGPDDEVLERDASGHPELHALLGDAALSRTHFFYRLPVPFPGPSTFALIVYGREARPALSERQLRLAREIAAALSQELGEMVAPDKAEVMPGTLGFAYEGFEGWVNATALPLAVLDGELHLRLTNAALRGLGPLLAALKPGEDPFPAMPAGELIRRMMERALKTGESTPEIEVAYDPPEGGPCRYFTVMGSPFRMVNREGPLLVVSLIEITREVLAHAQFEEGAVAGHRKAHGLADAATIGFLMETLVRRRSLRNRKGVSYLTTRAWREPIRDHQIKALKLLKADGTPRLGRAIAQDLKEEIDALMGPGGFRSVVPVPCGHSLPGQCLSRHVALELGRLLTIPVVESLRLPQSEEGSHPRKNARRSRMTALRLPDGPVLLVDDVATSGEHIEEACRLLRAGGVPVMALAWIGGNSGKDG